MIGIRRLAALAVALIALSTSAVATASSAAAADQTGSCSTSQTPKPLGTAIKGAIEVAGDVDAYRIKVPMNEWIGISLINLPADYGFDIRSLDGTLLRSVSEATGVGFERTFRRFSAGTYCIRVFGVGTAHSSIQYALVPQELGNSMRLLNPTVVKEGSYFYVKGEIFNGTSVPRRNMRINISLKNANGVVLSYDTLSVYSSYYIALPGQAIAMDDSVYHSEAVSVGFPGQPLADVTSCTVGDRGISVQGLSHVRAFDTHTAMAVVVNPSSGRDLLMYLNQYNLAGKLVQTGHTGYTYVSSASTQSFVVEDYADPTARRWWVAFYEEC